MAIYAADFGIAAAAAVPGLTEYSAAGAVTVARSTAGIVHLGEGFFVRDFTPHADTAALVWDVDGVCAREPVLPPVETSERGGDTGVSRA